LKLTYFIANRIAKAKKKTFSRFIMRISIIATTVSVASMIIAISFINGFQEVIAEKIFGFWGHVRVMHYEPVKATMAEETPIIGTDSILDQIKNHSNVKHVSAYATRSAILNANGTIEGVLLKGVSKDYPFDKLDRFLIKGNWPRSKESDSTSSGNIVISSYTASQLNTDTGKSILIYFIQDNGSPPKARKLKITGIFRTGIDVYDKVYALTELQLIQRMNGWSSSEIGGYEIDFIAPDNMDRSVEDIFTTLPSGWNALTLKELSPEIFDWLKLQNTNKYILIVLMTVVAIINLITCLIILLIERTRMIALLKAMGSNDSTIQKIFILYGSQIAVRGIFFGILLGLGICLIQKYTEFIQLNEEVYYVNSAPVSIDYGQVILIAAGTLILSGLMLIIPSYISRKIIPARALVFK
jgi:lipoprotein-releasing system permease protein